MMASESSTDPFDLPVATSPTWQLNHPEKSWNDLRHSVRKTRKLATSMLHRIPTSFTFRTFKTPNGTVKRVYFLGVKSGSKENTLMYIDVTGQATESDLHSLPWNQVLKPFQATQSSSQFTKEEQLLRERKRIGTLGISSYDYHRESGKFVFQACSSLYQCTDNSRDGYLMTEPVLPREIQTTCTSTRMHPSLCPRNADLLAFVSANDVWVINLQSGHEQRLTYARTGDGSRLEDHPISAGVPSFVVQEEFERFTGYWWQPKSSVINNEKAVYRILYEEVDESKVEIRRIISPDIHSSEVDEYRYPRAGTSNAKCTLKLVEFELGSDGTIKNVVHKELLESLDDLFPWMEYLPRAGWTRDGHGVYVQLMNRQQTFQQLIYIPLDNFFCSSGEMEVDAVDHPLAPLKNDNRYCPLSSMTSIQVLYEDRSDIWINVHNILYFMPSSSPDHIQFIWASEKTGFRHLYLVKAGINSQSSSLSSVQLLNVDPKANILEEVPLTSGPWEVHDEQVVVDELHQFVYFMGYKDSPLENHLYVISLTHPMSPVLLTTPGYSHSVTIDESCSQFLTVYSNIKQPSSSRIFNIEFTPDGQWNTPLHAIVQKTPSVPASYEAPEIFSYVSQSGHTMYGMYIKPYNMEAGALYPTLLYVYGGPQVQLVSNSFKGPRFFRLHTIAAQGYCVVVLDSRGSSNRGIDFEKHIKHRLGTVEIEDQVEGLKWMAKNIGIVDMDRVAIHGWSYGGYLSLMGLCQKPDIFKVAVAGAPVTSWELYDTGYTERYMDVPAKNREGYEKGSVLDQADMFPNECNRLLIIHGLIDENVHFSHTSELVNALISACKPYQLQVYPHERHGIRNPESNEHYETMVLQFLQSYL